MPGAKIKSPPSTARLTAVVTPAPGKADSPIEAGELEILTRGPVHEAFAALPVDQPAVPPLVRQKPPASLGEQIPRIKPAINAQWIPGYWHWNDDVNCWIWLSGTWRLAPPNRHWLPGYWSSDQHDWRWVSGFWKSGDSKLLTYVAAPPPLKKDLDDLRAGSDKFRLPGHWQPQGDKFIWRPSRLADFKTGQLWMPAQSYWTPAGYVFVDGYWDYPFDRRGWLFVPLGLTDSTADTAEFTYSPEILLNLKNISLELFACPAVRLYFFGGYEGSMHLHHGIYPLPRYAPLHDEPIFSYLAWLNGRQNPNWLRDAQAALRTRALNTAPNGAGNVANIGWRARQTLIWLNELAARPATRDRINRLGREQLAVVAQQIGEIGRATGERSSDELDRSTTQTASALSAHEAVAAADRFCRASGSFCWYGRRTRGGFARFNQSPAATNCPTIRHRSRRPEY